MNSYAEVRRQVAAILRSLPEENQPEGDPAELDRVANNRALILLRDWAPSLNFDDPWKGGVAMRPN